VSDSHDDDIEGLADDIASEWGKSFAYRRGSESQTLTMRMTKPPVFAIDNGAGQIVEVQPVDFIVKTSLLLYPIPLKGDRITRGDKTYEVQPPQGSDKVFFVKSEGMIRIHAKQIGG